MSDPSNDPSIGGGAGPGPGPAVADALRALGVRSLVLGIHDASFPAGEGDDTGRGTPCSPSGFALAAFLRRLGFDGIQLGPQGMTSAEDPSPYTGTLFSRDPLAVSLARLADPGGEWQGLLPAERLAALVAERPAGDDDRVPHTHVYHAHRDALAAAWRRFEEGVAKGAPELRELAARRDAFVGGAAHWLEADAVYEVLRDAVYGGREYDAWDGPHAALDHALGGALEEGGPFATRRKALAHSHGESLRLYRFMQFVAHAQHASFREHARRLGLLLYGDFQVGISPRDAWRHPQCFLPGYRLGAPPSRTNPEGQPWHYPVLDPARTFEEGGAPGPALRFLSARIEKTFAEYDALRVDHPQGLVCPWVYKGDDDDPGRAVRAGARLFSSPDLEDHPDLAYYAIATRGQLTRDPAVPRYDDHWVVALRPDQVERYAVWMDRLAAAAPRDASGRPTLACEVLSTLPYPLERVLARHGLGRFRVTQKAKLDDPGDVYRAENARPEDWVLFGNHDTPPLWQLLGAWEQEGRLEARAHHAATVLLPEAAAREREDFAAGLLRRPDRLAHAEIAQLFVSPAEQVMIFWADLFGVDAPFNRPGTIGGDNWRIRLPRDWQQRYREDARKGRALDLRVALAMALRARRGSEALVAALEKETWPPA